MSISNANRIAGPFIGAGTTSTFGFNFKVFSAADLLLLETVIATGTSSTLILGTNYTVSLNPNQDAVPGGTITLTAGVLVTGNSLVITSNIANLQPTVLTIGGGFFPTVINDALDRATIQIQQLATSFGNSLRAPLSDGNFPMILPAAGARANKLLSFDSNGNPVAGAAAPTVRGTWAPGTQYNYGDIVQDGAAGANTQNYYLCQVPNLSGVWATDLSNGDWLLAVNYQAALISLSGTSATAQTIGIGPKTFASQPGKQWVAGQFLMIASNANVLNFLHGQITSYDPVAGTLVMSIQDNGGTGTHTDWIISVSAQKGATGATGSAIPIVTAGGTSDVITATYNPVISSLTDGLVVLFTASAANTTTTPTFSPNGLPAHVITKNGGSALAPGDIPNATAVCQLEYNLAGTRWELVDANIFNEGNISLSDVTTNNASTSKHGFMPKGSGTTTNYFGGDNAEHALPFSKSFISTGQTITSGATTTLAHGLGSVPKLFTFYLKCLAGEAGYSIGDTVLISPNTMDGSTNRGFSAYFDSTNVYVIWAASGGSNQIFIIDKSAATAAPISNTNWELHVGAFA